jgi:hypothetical protein
VERENEAGCGFSGAMVEYPFRLDARGTKMLLLAIYFLRPILYKRHPYINVKTCFRICIRV